MPITADLFGNPLTETESRLVALYEELKSLVANPDLDPGVEANLRIATAALWNAVNDRALIFEQLYALGI